MSIKNYSLRDAVLDVVGLFGLACIGLIMVGYMLCHILWNFCTTGRWWK